ncbi:bifunctional tRNA (5-methylaminomethyl-2-thiouridine)(34)-methyltransferase MnmD/FAD-dependent 5-carboxymethylaminomethyl-2-thiouridine(34) oxidoreductase MnmC [Microbulbifer thermotolerans]|uniref:bifunctional tRNA (5-methylaminomethyl-2-thiouridine)(34)-methyltransferase MnmD/FAD-dependent 5-carboxymethylaminomethyl-2-thiouridine(34) oxidoreductase MnmC n=1 Tax=Microbulbifer thermotolerans TaxID=252514 RepID=UPI00224983A0|nr:bifunctional tRNA (5-methylaminomethyl-2-thiouridine)(34)-methyltransferase MnmD/FAD-dependent 5-carboxymethylaminomethyl-2-thiouridine(34) oxidoreductase MnmC [Microbulbifer thermotolerans]MCX2779672.1 bifunctional tRNA (5-methylaminomethyl-2-thiouridine)(34)-methyltransferase MnmD/FAD-dependent 5-carboxymethylaminomethyl-2-thiouridine(34) oxidoreductase MnmC [Microbulbifer thermotolerans]MCX2804897.1 bifunctional tRNA (5-methylaminomethyl-2-thiouridine)(34)-methyltransferase MnmD/FAD-depende
MREESPYADILWRDDAQPLSRAFDDIYFSTSSGLEESRYVFLQQNDLPQRWATLKPSDTFTIGETGFGTGLNFLTAWELWRQRAPAGARLHFISVEKYPLHPSDLRRALDLWPQLQPLAEQLIREYPPLLAKGVHRLHLEQATLTLVVGEASEAFHNLRLEDDSRDQLVDAWFLDGFAPAKNPAMWTSELFENLAALSRPGATFATFTCAGLVKRGLKAAGFTIQKVPGFGRKREMLRGRLEARKPSQITATPWHLPGGNPEIKIRKVAVVGAGISGATTARTLAERGIEVHVFDQAPTPGAGASGNAQGVLYAKLSPKPGPNGDFNLHALMYALRYYQRHCPESVHFSGLLQLAQTDKERQLQAQIGQWLAPYRGKSLATEVTPAQASEIAGLPLAFGGLYFPQAGWLEPQKVCEALLRHRNIHLHYARKIDQLTATDCGWQLTSAETGLQEETAKESVLTADAVVICTANGIRHFLQTAALPLRPIRGQVSSAPADDLSRQLKITLCGEGYIAPAHNGRHCFGATFKLKETATDLRAEEHRENLHTLAEMLPPIADAFSTQSISGRAALRAATPDYLPIAGPIPIWDSLEETYAELRKNRKRLIPQKAPYQPHLYALGGLGSRGFAYAPLAAEVIAAWLCGEAMPVCNTLAKALHPARFAVRDLGKNRKGVAS